MKDIHNSNNPPDFSLVLGGPFFQLMMRLGLITPSVGLLKKKYFLHPVHLGAFNAAFFNSRQCLGKCGIAVPISYRNSSAVSNRIATPYCSRASDPHTSASLGRTVRSFMKG